LDDDASQRLCINVATTGNLIDGSLELRKISRGGARLCHLRENLGFPLFVLSFALCMRPPEKASRLAAENAIPHFNAPYGF